MGYNTQDEIVKIVNRLIKRCGTRNPYKVADELGIHILYRDFTKQRGAYKVILKNRFIFLQNGLHPVIEQIVLWHEIGHDVLHRQEAVSAGGFKEFNIFDMRENRMEVHEKRILLEAIEILVKRPAQADETTLGNAIGYFTKLVEDLTQGQITLLPVQKQQLKNAIEEIA